MKKYRCEFTVEGDGEFPIDMMRYDRCTPATQEDVGKMSMVGVKRCVVMVAFVESKLTTIPTIRRWESFGWKVYPNIQIDKLT